MIERVFSYAELVGFTLLGRCSNRSDYLWNRNHDALGVNMTEFETKVLKKLDALISMNAAMVGTQFDNQVANGQMTLSKAIEMAGDIEKIMVKSMDDWTKEEKKD